MLHDRIQATDQGDPLDPAFGGFGNGAISASRITGLTLSMAL